MTTTTTQRLATLLLGQDVTQWVTERHTRGDSLRQIRDELATATNGQLDVSHITIRNWLQPLPRLDSNQQPSDYQIQAPTDAPLDPDCRDGKHMACAGGPCRCECHPRTAAVAS